jgi:hypothetical protein
MHGLPNICGNWHDMPSHQNPKTQLASPVASLEPQVVAHTFPMLHVRLPGQAEVNAPLVHEPEPSHWV